MANEISSKQSIPPTPNTPHVSILDQTLGDILQNNPQAQQMITTSMGISHEKFQEMLTSAQQNNMMHMKIGDLFKSGIVQQAVQQNPSASSGQVTLPNGEQGSMFVSGPMQVVQSQQVQVTPEQLQQLQNGALQPQQLLQQAQPELKKSSLFDRIKNLFR